MLCFSARLTRFVFAVPSNSTATSTVAGKLADFSRSKSRLLSCRVIQFSAYSTMSQANGTADKKSFQRLPEHSKPTNYAITLKTDLEKFEFHGQQKVKVQVLEPTDSFTLHSKKLTINSASVTAGDGEHKGAVTVNEKEEKIEIKFDKQLAAGDVVLDIDFTGVLNDSMHGFYRSKYRVPGSDQDKFIASTQFESTYARLAFPCWDEPVYKATFDITLTVKEAFTALSNGVMLSEKPTSDGWKEVKFDTTPIMSSYLVAFAVGDFAYKETKTKEGIVVRVYMVKHNIEHTDFALDCAKRALEYYNDFFGIVYPIPKCDLIGIPDFSMGAMENWGLVTYREVLLLVDPKRTSMFVKSRVALVIAHELAHMWFGDLVTMKWWTDLWLKEGFATFMEYLFVEHAYPEFEIMQRFVKDECVTGLRLDAKRSSHPIEVEIDDPNELEEIYDSITYAKASTVNRMLHSYLGNEVFQAGLRVYLNKFKYSNAVTKDLWAALGEAAKQDIEPMMSSWTKQMGFPVVNASLTYDDGKATLKLKQERFIADGSADESNPLWKVPITVVSSSGGDTVTKFMLTDRQHEFTLDGVKQGDWVKLNSGMTAYYRTQYDEAMAQALLEPLKAQKLGATDRFNLLSDMLALMRAGRVPVSQLLDVIKAISASEEVMICWMEMDSAIGTCCNVLQWAEDKTILPRFQKFVIDQYKTIADKLTWEVTKDESPQRASLRAVILGRMGKCGHQETIAKAQQLFQAHIKDNVELQADLRRVIYDLVAINGGEQAFDEMVKICENNQFPEVQRNALLCLGSSSEQSVLEKCLQYTVKSGKVRKQDMLLPFVSMARSTTGQTHMWTYFKQNLEDLVKLYETANSALFQHIMQTCIESHCKEEVAKEAEELIGKSAYATTLDRPMRQSCEEVRLNAAILKREVGVINTWLEQNKY